MDDETAMLYSPEGGDLIRVALGMYRENGMDADLLLSGFSGETYGKSRAGTGTVRLEAPVIAMLGLIQPLLLSEAFQNTEAEERGLLGRLLSVTFDFPAIEDSGQFIEVCESAEKNWERVLCNVLAQRFERSARVRQVECSVEAREVLRLAHNEIVRRLNGKDSDVRNFLIRYRENCCRVALCFHIVDNPAGVELSKDTAERAVRVVSWIMDHTIEMMTAARVEKLKGRLQLLNSLVLAGGFITLRELKRSKGRFSESEVRQLCLLSNGTLVFSEYRPPSGGPVSLRVTRSLVGK